MPNVSPPRPPAHAWLPTLLVCVIPLAAAQTSPSARSDPANPAARVPPAAYRSTLADYRRHAEQPVGSWKEVNETVNRVGGWRVYAREASQPDAAASAPKPAPADHAGHRPAGR